MFKTLAFQPENGFFVGDLPDSCGAPLSAISMAIVIIPNSARMFNKNLTFLKKKLATEHSEKKGYQAIRKSGCRVTGNQDIRIY